jgi:hypothetical protein
MGINYYQGRLICLFSYILPAETRGSSSHLVVYLGERESDLVFQPRFMPAAA